MKKLRTRQHIIEDLGFNQVERQVLLTGCTLQRMYPDYGYDGYIHLYSDKGEYTNGLIKFQLKSTDQLKLWLLSTQPVVVLLYDASQNTTYYVNLQDYFTENRMALKDVRKFVRIYIPLSDIFDGVAMQKLKTVAKID